MKKANKKNQKLHRHLRRKLKGHEKLDLPVPRLEIRKHLLPDSDKQGYDIRADYSLVYEHLDGSHIAVPFGQTRIGTDLKHYRMFDLPFRDGAHMLNEMYFLRLRGFVVYGDKYEEVFCTPETMPNGLTSKIEREKQLRKQKALGLEASTIF